MPNTLKKEKAFFQCFPINNLQNSLITGLNTTNSLQMHDTAQIITQCASHHSAKYKAESNEPQW